MAEVQIEKDTINKLEVKKNNSAKVKEIWKYSGGAWSKVWDLSDGGPFILSNNNTPKSKIQDNPTNTNFTKDDKFRIVAEAVDSNGNSTVIEEVVQK